MSSFSSDDFSDVWDMVSRMQKFIEGEDSVIGRISKSELERMNHYSEAVDSVDDLILNTSEDVTDTLSIYYYVINCLALRYLKYNAENSVDAENYFADVTHFLTTLQATSILVAETYFTDD